MLPSGGHLLKLLIWNPFKKEEKEELLNVTKNKKKKKRKHDESSECQMWQGVIRDFHT